MATVRDVAMLAKGAVSTSASIILVARWVHHRYQEFASRQRMRHLRTTGTFRVPASITAGTVTATNGSRVVTGDATAKAAWSVDLAGRYILLPSSAWYRIEGFNGTSLALDEVYVGDTISDTTYTIVQRYSALGSDVQYVGRFMLDVHRKRVIELVSAEEMEIYSATRHLLKSGPSAWTESGVTLDGEGNVCRQVELYPYDTKETAVAYVYWRKPPFLKLHDELPTGIEPYTLREGVLVDIMRYEMSKALEAGMVDKGATWRNEYRAQETKWAQARDAAVRQETATDDDVFILDLARGAGTKPYRIRTAREQIWYNWSR